MLSFVLKRIGSGILLVFVISSLTFAMLRMTGQDVARTIVGQNASAEVVAAKRAELGLDQPLLVQYGNWLADMARGDFGSSWITGNPVATSLSDRLPVTLSIVIAGLLISAIFSVLLGVAAALRGGWLDRSVQVLGVVGFAVPNFLVALLLTYYVAVSWMLLPATGFVKFSESPLDWLKSITLPAISLAIGAMAATAQQIRGSMVDVLRMDYVRTLRARGLPSRSVLYKHALRNAAPAGLTVLSLQFIAMMGGAVIVEKVFGLQGIGTMANNSASAGDSPELMGVVVLMVAIVVFINLLLDVAFGLLNPKVRVS
ncbi:MAG TPA: ABC transporter permease [Propionicimonas sp.]|nr:ABC transporter permease [Propionicimonas sp.]HRA06365.1 ABC transporter permease [Propionicimonas sp.]